MGRLRDRKNQINIAIQDSLEKVIQDSLKQAEIDSIALEEANLLKNQKKIDSLSQILDGIEEFGAFNTENQQIIKGPVFNSTIDPTVLEESILNLTRDLLAFEARTNVTEDYDNFVEMYDELVQIHKPYQDFTGSAFTPGSFGIQKGEGEWQFGLPDINVQSYPLLNEENLRFKDMNSLDKIFGDVLNIDVVDEDGLTLDIPSDRSLERVTMSRLFASDKVIRDLVYGSKTIDPSSQNLVHQQGFNDIIRNFNLGGGTGFGSGENIKWALNYPLGETILLTDALKAKSQGIDYFLQPDKLSSQFINALSGYSDVQQNQINLQLQEIVNEIHLRMEGINTTIGGSAYFEKFNKLKKRFGQDWIYNTETSASLDDVLVDIGRTDTPGQYHGLSPQDDPIYQTYQDKKDKLYKEIAGYEFLTGEKYDTIEALNMLSIEALDTQLEDLPDYEKTQAFEDLLVTLSNQLGQVYTPAK